MTTSFLLSGSGGQGVITMAILLAQAAALYENRLPCRASPMALRPVVAPPARM